MMLRWIAQLIIESRRIKRPANRHNFHNEGVDWLSCLTDKPLLPFWWGLILERYLFDEHYRQRFPRWVIIISH
jgi:hypothetical protein